tara:strand:+ start:289 stop:438 length:150 start_codon:yes stop_codon:yes gene_type:complete
MDGDLQLEITPLSPILASGIKNASGDKADELMERMIAVELQFDNLDMSG